VRYGEKFGRNEALVGTPERRSRLLEHLRLKWEGNIKLGLNEK
jgi:hypothetical protein